MQSAQAVAAGAAAAASKHGDKDLQRATCITTHTPPPPPPPPTLTASATNCGKMHFSQDKTRRSREQMAKAATREMQSQVVISHIGEHSRLEEIGGAGQGLPWSCSTAGKVNIKVHADKALRVNV